MEEIIEYISGEKADNGHTGMEKSENKRHQRRTRTIDRIMNIGGQPLYHRNGAAIHCQTDSHYDNSEYTHIFLHTRKRRVTYADLLTLVFVFSAYFPFGYSC